jgi:hypothetical protein
MISNAYRCIFIHVPKCAGTSIESALGHHADYEGRGRQDHRTLAQIEPWGLRSAFFAESQMATKKNLSALLRRSPNPANRYKVSREQYESYYKFAIVRNPWTRAVSWYKNAQRDQLHQKVLDGEPGPFKQFLQKQIGKGMLRPQTYWLRNRSGKIDFDFIGRIESLDADFAHVCDKIQAPKVQLQQLLRSPKSPSLTEFFDHESDALIRSHYGEEIELFSYSFPE